MLAELKKVRFPFETGLLLAFCIFLPLLEFWKNAALLAYVLTWLVNRVRTRTIGNYWGWSDRLVIAWIGLAYLAAVFAGLNSNAWAKTGDVAVSALLFWLVARAGYASREMRYVLGALVLSTLAGLAIGFWRISSGASKSGMLQLYSVGQVNHTAIYIAMILGLCVSWLFACWRVWPASRRVISLGIVASVLASLVVTASRAAVSVGFVLVLILALAWWPRWRAPLAASVVVIGVVAATMMGFGAEVLRKHMDYVATQNVYSERDAIWRMGLAAWAKYPWFGVGKDNYGLISHELVRSWRAEAGKDYDEARYVRFPHAHSLYINTLVERGAIGFATLAAVLLAALVALLRFRPRPDDGNFAWLAWGGALSAWIVTAGVGTVNTTLHHEHGLLAALLLGLWLSTLRARRAS